MPYWLKRHPFPVVAHFRDSLVLAYAFPQELLVPLLPPGLTLDVHQGYGIVAIALVQTESLRPVFLPKFLGCDFFLSGYRIFTRFRTSAGRTLRGLRILRSDTDRRMMAFFGNRLTHYNYSLAAVDVRRSESALEIHVETKNRAADLHVLADLMHQPTAPPEGSPFKTLTEARRFAGPLPWTFNYESATHSIIMIEGVRENWEPRPITVNVQRVTFFDQPPFKRTRPILANAFYVQNISYRWERGRREPLPGEPQ
ncbi:MAG TPA: DUF2071 domain-containing protein [Phycisphaerae bacterium]|jgi:uncharacterized protein YqjF (DUF2071 family)